MSDVIVVGLGAMGSATCAQLAARGVSVLGLDRFAPPHPYGSTHSDTRITRLAVGEGPEYVPLVRRSHELWRELESRSGGGPLLIQCGGLIVAEARSEFFADTVRIAGEHAIAHELLSSDGVRERFPMFAVTDAMNGYYEPEAGYVRPEAAVAAQLQLARAGGARLLTGETVTGWSADGAGVAVGTAAGVQHRADRLVLCAGAWLPQLFPQGRALFAVHRQLLHWFPIRHGYEALRDMPIFVWLHSGTHTGFVHLRGFYGFPAIDGPAGGVKLATESYERTTAPDGRQHPATAEERSAMYRDYVAPALPWLGPEPVRTASCLYTCTLGSRFVIDRHPEHEAVTIVSPCSGHGFKHSAAIGEAVAQRLTGGRSAIDLSPFSLARAEAWGNGGITALPDR